jgi:CBS domain-containing protein
MENSKNGENANAQDPEFKRFATKHIIAGVLVAVVLLWMIGMVLGFFGKSTEVRVAGKHETTAPESAAKKQIAQRSAAEHHEKPGVTASKDHPSLNTHTINDLISSQFIVLDKNLKAGEAIDYIKKHHRNIKEPLQLYVVGENQTLEGVVSLKQLILAGADEQLEDFMNTEIKPLKIDQDKNKAAKLVSRYHVKVFPVIDDQNRIVGVVKADDIDIEDTTHLAKTEQKTTVGQTPSFAHQGAAKEVVTPAHTPAEPKSAESAHAPAHEVGQVAELEPKPKGVAFVEATIAPLNYELNERWWGWRPNDILDFTDNVNNFQLGVLEVTRRTVVILAERISRTGATAAFDRNLENAMNWFMIKSDRYWFPSPESKYKDGLKELKLYKEKLAKGSANFHTRTDNLIPLLMAYEDLLGSCEENLVKTNEENGEKVSFFQADDYFFYAKGVASAMGTLLEAIMEDFLITVESRRGTEVLHHAIESCHHAAAIDPWVITNSSLSGVLANHRANLAAPMSHARFYISVLIKTLST